MGRVVVAVAWLVVAVGKNGQMALGMRGHELGFRTSVVERLLAGVKLEVGAVLGSTAETLSSGVALTTAVVNCTLIRVVVPSTRVVRALTLGVALVFELVLVFLVATITLGMVRLGLARATTMFALLDGTTLWVDVVQLAICRRVVSPGFALADMAALVDVLPPWLQPLTRCPLMQDEQAHFSPSMTGIPRRSRPNAVVAGGPGWAGATVVRWTASKKN